MGAKPLDLYEIQLDAQGIGGLNVVKSHNLVLYVELQLAPEEAA